VHAPSYVESKLRVALGTFVAVDAEAADRNDLKRGIAAAFDAVSTVERLMHPTRAGSDLAALAECPAGRPLTVHAWTFEVLELCRRLHGASQGIFDPCLDSAPGRMADLDVGPECKVVPRVRMRVDLGGIAKGYAVDRALSALRDAGCTRGLVNAGGDLAVFGERSHTGICRAPGGGAAFVEIRDAALASSDTGDFARPVEHRGYYHGLDRGAAVSGKVTVSAPCAAIADGLTKCLLIGGAALNGTLLSEFDAKQIHFT
jgi:thiamine biosynthesis lipoprotein